MASHFDVDVTIRALYPYLIGKWQQAYVVLEYLTIAPGHPSHADGFSRARGKRPTAGGRYDERHWELVKTLRRLNRRYARGEWQTRDAASKEAEKPDTPPGHQPMDPLKRWYKLYVG